MGILSTHTDVWKCENVKISLHFPSVFPLPVKNCIFPPYFSQNLLSRFVYLRFFSYLCTKFGMFPLGHKKGTCHKEAWGEDERGKRWRREGQNIAARCSLPHFLAARARLEENHISTFPHIHVGCKIFNFSLIIGREINILVKFFTFPPKSPLIICFFDIFFLTL